MPPAAKKPAASKPAAKKRTPAKRAPKPKPPAKAPAADPPAAPPAAPTPASNADPVETVLLSMRIGSDGRGELNARGVSSFGLTIVTATPNVPDLSWEPDPDNPEDNTIFRVAGAIADSRVDLELFYPAM